RMACRLRRAPQRRGCLDEQAGAAGDRAEGDAVAVQGLLDAEEQTAVVDQSALQVLENLTATGRLHVAEHMAAEDDVEAVLVSRRVEQVGADEMHRGAQLGPGDPV